MLLTGQFEHSIDAKSRLAIPSEIRSRWRAEEHGAGWYAVPWPGPMIRLYPEVEFERRYRAGPLTLTPGEDEAELQATLFGESILLEMDSVGRIRLPEDMLALLSMPREVVLVGAGDRLEVRSRDQWRRDRAARLAKLPELISRLGRAGAPGRGSQR